MVTFLDRVDASDLDGSGGGGIRRSLVLLLLKLPVSNGRLDFGCFSKNGCSAGESFGEPYAFGIAGTGGTSSSSSSFPAELWTVREFGLGVGSREVDALGGSPGSAGILGCKEPVEVLAVLKEVADADDRPELYDLRFWSGVVRKEDGVLVFIGIADGDLDAARGML